MFGKNPIKPKHILFIEDNLDGTIGGSHYCLLEIVKRLNREKFIPFVVFYQENTLINEFRKVCQVVMINRTKGFIIEKNLPELYRLVKKRRFLKYPVLLYQRTYNFLGIHFVKFLRMQYLLFKFKIDIVHLNDAPALTDVLIPAKLLGKKCVAHLRGNWEPKPLQRKLVKYYDSVISISHSVTNHAKIKGLNTRNFITLHDGIDINGVLNMRKRDADEVKKEFYQSNNDSSIIGIIGNIKAWKGQHVAIEAIKILKEKHSNLRCLIVGDVSNFEEDKKYFDYLNEMVKENGLNKNIIFTGYRQDVIDIISSLDILVHTSVEPEPLGRVIFEGMIFSKPIIATAHGGPVEIIEDGISGFLVPPNDSTSLAEKIDYLISNPDIGEVVGKQGRKRVEKFNIAINVKKIEQIYTQLLNI